ncbi:MAG: hypothetical protein ACC652_07120, partial [Acidimicrobiales bacterium]
APQELRTLVRWAVGSRRAHDRRRAAPGLWVARLCSDSTAKFFFHEAGAEQTLTDLLVYAA